MPFLMMIAPLVAATQLYVHAMTTMHAMTDPPYVKFDVEVRTEHASKVRTWTGTDRERTQDRMTIVRDSSGGNEQRAVISISPDIFVRHAGAPANAGTAATLDLGTSTRDASLQTIATVTAVDVPYAIAASGTEDLPGCAGATHLSLTPKSDPLRFNLRSLWIEPGSGRICRAIAVWRFPVITHDQDVPVTLEVGRDGMISHWSLSATARMLFSSYSVTQEASYSDITPISEVDWK